ncbi:NAD(P)/FAD-dependent oxidoreductase [Saccharopolyspora cebuensis]|uniref:NAD(P)/FAD-dependent oxidoreductase n=1 Tax=Saccharopolyspora cebuensis TaxID=418759 RepID=A0ABV4CJF5_9PSEU
MSRTEHVLVVGAGVAGLTAAICLDMAGIRATVHEARPEHADVGASYLIRNHGQRVLDRMGLLDEVNRHALPMPLRYFTLQGSSADEVVYPPSDMDHEEGGISQAVCIDRSTFVNILLAEARRRGVVIAYNKRLHTLEQGTDAVTAVFTDGSRAEGDVLIGADGRGSATRSVLFPHARLAYTGGWNVYGRSRTETLAAAPAAELVGGAAFMHTVQGLSCMAYRDDALDPANITWLLSGTTARKLPAKDFELADRQVLLKELEEGLRHRSPFFADIIRASVRTAPTQVFHLPPLPAWSQGRVALIGDTVHAADPMTGMGTTLALEDGMYVAKMLREHHYIDAFYYLHADRHQAAEEFNAELDPDRIDDNPSRALNSYRFDVNWDLADERPLSALLSAAP